MTQWIISNFILCYLPINGTVIKCVKRYLYSRMGHMMWGTTWHRLTMWKFFTPFFTFCALGSLSSNQVMTFIASGNVQHLLEYCSGFCKSLFNVSMWLLLFNNKFGLVYIELPACFCFVFKLEVWWLITHINCNVDSKLYSLPSVLPLTSGGGVGQTTGGQVPGSGCQVWYFVQIVKSLPWSSYLKWYMIRTNIYSNNITLPNITNYLYSICISKITWCF